MMADVFGKYFGALSTIPGSIFQKNLVHISISTRNAIHCFLAHFQLIPCEIGRKISRIIWIRWEKSLTDGHLSRNGGFLMTKYRNANLKRLNPTGYKKIRKKQEKSRISLKNIPNYLYPLSRYAALKCGGEENRLFCMGHTKNILI